MSDHGIRWGPVRQVPQGKVEENMPFLYFVFPKSFQNKYKLAMSNIKANRKRLTSPYDTYETLKDILYFDSISDKNIKLRGSALESNITRGISLFLEVPKSRTCKMAGIAEHFCACHSSKIVPTDDEEVVQGANYAVYTLNSYVANFSKCAYLGLSAVSHAQYNLYGNSSVNKGERVIEIAFETDPGKGTFEATVVKDSKGKWGMSGTVSRTNLYGNQSVCVDDKEMKKFCYCLK